MTDTPRDYHGRPFREGDEIVVAQTRGSSGAWLDTRYVHKVEADHLIVWPGTSPPKDKRQWGRMTKFQASLIVGR
jgi:hypothetical protein